MTEMALQTAGLTKSYGGKRVVDNLDLAVKTGCIYGFLGPNGAGKTTTMRMILGLISRDAGTVQLFGDSDPIGGRRHLGGIVEGPRFYEYLSGIENLRVLESYGPGVSESRLRELLSMVRLADRAEDRVKTYSLGMKQRLGIAQALLGDPKLLLLDEPTNGLDPAGMKEVRELIRTMQKERGLTVFVSSHLLAEVEALCDEVGVIQEGSKVAEGSVDELIEPGESLEDCFLRLTGADASGGQIR